MLYEQVCNKYTTNRTGASQGKHTHTHTHDGDDDGIYCASIASRGKNAVLIELPGIVCCVQVRGKLTAATSAARRNQMNLIAINAANTIIAYIT